MRDEVQDRVLASSNQKCGHFIRTLYAQKASGEAFYGGLSTLFAGTGAVLSHVPTAQAFSAGGAVFSGINSEIGQAYFANKAIEVITAGIHARRQSLLEEIYQRRISHQAYIELNGSNNMQPAQKKKTKAQPITYTYPMVVAIEESKEVPADKNTATEKQKSDQKAATNNKTNGKAAYYSLNASIRDAVQYHASCATIVGLEVAAESISRVTNPGAEELGKFLDKLQKYGLDASIEAHPAPDSGADTK